MQRPPVWGSGLECLVLSGACEAPYLAERPSPLSSRAPWGKKNFKGEEIMSKIINVGVGGTDEDKDVRKGTYKTLKRKQSILDKELTPALRKELKEKVEIFLKFY